MAKGDMFSKKMIWLDFNGRYRECQWKDGYLYMGEFHYTPAEALVNCSPVQVSRGETLNDCDGCVNWFLAETKDYVLVCCPDNKRAVETDGKIPDSFG